MDPNTGKVSQLGINMAHFVSAIATHLLDYEGFRR
jgi:hypothetical protein